MKHLSKNAFIGWSFWVPPKIWGQGLMALEGFISLEVLHSFNKGKHYRAPTAPFKKCDSGGTKIVSWSKSHNYSWEKELEHKHRVCASLCISLKNCHSLQLSLRWSLIEMAVPSLTSVSWWCNCSWSQRKRKQICCPNTTGNYNFYRKKCSKSRCKAVFC